MNHGFPLGAKYIKAGAKACTPPGLVLVRLPPRPAGVEVRQTVKNRAASPHPEEYPLIVVGLRQERLRIHERPPSAAWLGWCDAFSCERGGRVVQMAPLR